jgi:hypothetical protein
MHKILRCLNVMEWEIFLYRVRESRL